MRFQHIQSNIIPELEVKDTPNGRFYKSPSGVLLPSVTTVLSHFKGKELEKWQERVGEEEAGSVLRRAGLRGNKYHKLVEDYLNNQHDTMFRGIMPDMKQMFVEAKKSLDKIDNIRYIETNLWSERLGIAGRCDLVAEYDGVLSIIDHKTSRNEKRKEWISSYFEQGTAYSLMLHELTGLVADQVVIIIADSYGVVQTYIEPTESHVQNLLEKVKIYHAKVQDCM